MSKSVGKLNPKTAALFVCDIQVPLQTFHAGDLLVSSVPYSLHTIGCECLSHLRRTCSGRKTSSSAMMQSLTALAGW